MKAGVLLKSWLLVSVVLVDRSCAANSAPTVGIYTLDDQRVSGGTTVFGKEASFGDFTVLVTIDTAGNVIKAEATDNYQKLDPAPALAAVRKWKFRPQIFDGKPVNAVGRVNVDYRKSPIPADASIPFPKGEPAETSITLERSACYGTCPDYRLTVRGDGLVQFDTGNDHFRGSAAEVHLEYNGHNVLLPGPHTARIDPLIVAKLLDRFQAAHFFGLQNEYSYGATDASTQKLTVRVGSASKSVTDYIGTMAGMPQEVRDLEDAVDEAAGTARWVNGDEQTLAELDAAHFNYRSGAGAKLAIAAVQKLNDYRSSPHTEAFLIGLVERGVPLDAKVGEATVGTTLVQVAANKGNEALFAELSERKVLAATPRSSITSAFSDVGCSAKIARTLVANGADPHIVSDNGTALTRLRGSGASCEDHPEKMMEMAHTLIALGVPLEARDNLGWTALMGCDSPELAQLLLNRGANANARTKDGTTPVLATDDDRVAVILLRAGADPRARNDEGSVRKQAIKYVWPATIAWLDQHGVQ